MWLTIPIDLETDAANVHLLKELERWVELGLLSDGQVHSLGRKLCSPLPIAYKAPAVEQEALVEADIAVTEPVIETSVSPARPLFSQFKSRLVASFLAEVSVLWLLFLGVFLVVVSSGVLAASQWQSFSTVGQYAILLVYTLAFGGASYWAARQANLQTTAHMLKAATLLLVPLNLWMMDDSGLGQMAWGLVALASIGLSALTLVLAPQKRVGLNLLGLSWLHWGWGLASWPLIATYLGTLVSAANLVGAMPRAIANTSGANTSGSDTSGSDTSVGGGEGEPFPQSGELLVAIALLILLIRSFWVAQVAIDQLGLAVGLCGWMVLRLNRRYPLWSQVGAGLMLLGWLVTVDPQPLQAIGVSGLASWLLIERLQRQSQALDQSPEEPPEQLSDQKLEQLSDHKRDQLRTLAILWLVGLQACGLMWLTLPMALRQTLLTAVGRLGPDPVSALNFAGVWLYGYVGLMILAARQFHRRDSHRRDSHHKSRADWALLTEQIALGISGLLVLWVLPQSQSFLLTLSFLGLTLTLAAVTRWQRRTGLIYGTHGAALATVLSWLYVISERLGGWTAPQWALALMALTAVEWMASVASPRYPQWRRSAWYLGIGLSGVAYTQLLDNWDSWLNLVWLGVPGVLTWVVFRRQFATERPQVATLLTVFALGGQLLLVSSWPMATVAFAIGAGLLWFHSVRWSGHGPSPTYFLPALTVGFVVGGAHTAALWRWSQSALWPDNLAQLWLVSALVASALSILARFFDQPSAREHRSSPLLRAYATASRGWSRGIAIALALSLTLIMILVYTLGLEASHWMFGIGAATMLLRYGIAAIILLIAGRFTERRLTNLHYGEIAYGVGLLVAMGLPLWHGETNPALLGTAMVALALVTQLLGTVYAARPQRSYRASWHYIPLAYGALGLGLSHLSLTATTGVYAMVIGIVTLAVGRRQVELRPLGYGGLGLLSLGAYELVIYQMLQASGGEAGDGLTLLALVGGAIAALYLLCHRLIQYYSKLAAADIGLVSLLHWLLAVVLAAMAMVSGQSRFGLWLWLGVASLLSFYAALRGNARWFPAAVPDDTPADPPKDASETVPEKAPGTTVSASIPRAPTAHPSYPRWTWSSLIIATIALPHGAGQLLPNLTFVQGWGALCACGLSLIVHRLPWRRWGWPVRPWQQMALGWPVIALLLSIITVKTQVVLLVGAFYAFMAKQRRAIRLSYLSLALLNWALLRYLIDQGWLSLLWLGLMLGLSGLYVLEVDPHWQPMSARQARHRLRSFATLLIGLSAIFQAEATAPIFIGLSLLLSFGFIGLGLVTQIRAYLFMGTLTFALQIVRTIAMFISTDGRMLWAIGIVLGIALIWVAATFEARRAQINELLNQWSDRLQNWE